MSNNAQIKHPKAGPMKRLFSLLRLFGIVLFVVIMFRVDFPKLLEQLSQASPGYLFIGFLFQLIVLITKGIRWHLMNDGGKGKQAWRQSLGRFYESYAIGVVTPARMGELLKAGHEEGAGNMLATGIRVVAERGLDIGVFVILAALSVFGGNYIGMNVIYTSLILFAGFASLTVSMLLLASEKFNALLNAFFQPLPSRFSNTRIAFKGYQPHISAGIILLSLFSNISYFVSCYFLALAIGLEAGFIWTSGAVAVSGLLNMLPVTIMGVGTRELTFLYVFRSFPQALALSFSFLVMLVAQMGGGLVSLVAGQLLLHSKTENKHV